MNLLAGVARIFTFDVLAKALLAAMGILLIRVLSTRELAAYTLASSVVALCGQVFGGSFSRAFAASRARGSAGALAGLQLLLLAALAAAAFPFRDSFRGVFFETAAFAAAVVLVEGSKAILQNDLDFRRFSLAELVRAALLLGGVGALIAVEGTSLRAGHTLLAQAAALGLLFGALFVHRLGRPVEPRPEGSFKGLFAYLVLISTVAQSDVIVLHLLGDEARLGAYGSALRFYFVLSMGLNAVQVVYFPATGRATSVAELDAIFRRHRLLVALFAPVALAAAALSPVFIPWVDGGRFPDAVPTFQLLSVLALIAFAFSPHGYLLLRYGDYRFLLVLASAMLPLHAALLAWLGRTWGAPGAAMANVIDFGIINTAVFLRARALRGSGRPLPEARLEPH